MSDWDDEMEEGDEAPLDWKQTTLPYVVIIACVLGGTLAGGVVGWVSKPIERVEVPVPRELTLAEIETVCAPQVVEKAEALTVANERIVSLTAEVEQRKARVEDLEDEMARRSDAGRALALELETARQALASVTQELTEVKEQKAQLEVELELTVTQLEQTEEALEVQVQRTERAKEDALVNKWYRFLNDAQLTICERGNRKKLGRCRETVTMELGGDATRDRFAHCVRSRQSAPSVHELKKGTQLPEFASYINEDDRVVRDWYVQYCDPTLPEADGFLNEEALPSTGTYRSDPVRVAPPTATGDDLLELDPELFDAPASAPAPTPRPAEVFDPEDADRDDLFELLDDDLKDLSDEL